MEIEAKAGLAPEIIEIRVNDTGPGMTAEDIFQLFQEAHEKQNISKNSSRGDPTLKNVDLGLKMVNKLASMLGNKRGEGIHVKKQIGEGIILLI